jgi:hypothetical protein
MGIYGVIGHTIGKRNVPNVTTRALYGFAPNTERDTERDKYRGDNPPQRALYCLP